MNGQFSVKLLQKLNTYGQKTVNVKLIYWVKGQGTIDINLKQYHMTEGDIVLLMLNDLYQIQSDDDAVTLVVDLSFKDYVKYASEYIDISGYKLSNIEKQQVLPILMNIIELECFNKADEQTTLKMIKHLCVELGSMSHLYRAKTQNMTVLDEVHDYLISHHTKKLKKQEIANALNMTNQELSNVIKYQTPFQSINQYVNDIRLKCALIDILKEHRTVEDIAYQHGFNHYSRFINLFKDSYGYTPKEIRKQYHSLTTSYYENIQYLPLSEQTYQSYFHKVKHYTTVSNNKDIILSSNTLPICHIESKDLFITSQQLLYLNEHQIFYVTQHLFSKNKHVYVIIPFDLTDFSAVQRMCEYYLTKLNYLGLTPIFYFKGLDLTYLEQHGFNNVNQLFITLFYSRFVNEVDGVSIMLDSTDKQVIQKVVNEVRQFFNRCTLYLSVPHRDVRPYEFNEIDEYITSYFITFEQLTTWKKYHHKVILDTTMLNMNQNGEITQQNIINFSLMARYYLMHKGISFSLDFLLQYLFHGRNMDNNMFLAFFNMMNQLRGDIVHQDNQIILTKFKFEYQCLAFNMNISTAEQLQDLQLNFKTTQPMSHAESSLITYTKAPNLNHHQDQTKNKDNLFQPHFWKGQLSYPTIINRKYILPSMSIGHIKFSLRS